MSVLRDMTYADVLVLAESTISYMATWLNVRSALMLTPREDRFKQQRLDANLVGYQKGTH